MQGRKPNSDNWFLEKIDTPKLNEEKNELLDCELSVMELTMALK